MKSTITSPEILSLLDSLYADAAKTPFPSQMSGAKTLRERNSRETFHELRHVYMAIAKDFGNLLYALVRSSNSKHVVEFGTSMGVSTIYLAAALKDNGGGRLITTEFEPEKIERARANLTTAGLGDFVEFRAGDALESLNSELPDAIDFVFLDGAKLMYLDVLKLLEPNLRQGSIVASDNTDHEGLEEFLSYVRNPNNGYVSSGILTARDDQTGGHEISVRC